MYNNIILIEILFVKMMHQKIFDVGGHGKCRIVDGRISVNNNV